MLYGGARGGGKSYLGCRRAVELAEDHPGIRGYLCRAEVSTFRRTTLTTLIDQVGILSRAGWHMRSTEQYFIHDNGSRLDFGGLAGNEDRDRVKSMETTFAFVDEASDVEALSARMLEASCHRQPAFAGLSFVLYASNPEPCWLQSDFVDRAGPGRAYVPALPADNPYLDPGYVEHLLETYADYPELVDAYLHGSWGAVGSADRVFPAPLVAAARQRTGEPDERQVQWGVDVARYGDDKTVVFERRGDTARLMAEWTHTDTRSTSDKIAALYKAATTKPTWVVVDDIGVGGGVVDNLKAARVPVRGVNVGEAAKHPERFANRRAEVAWHLRGVLEAGGCLPDDPDLASELMAMKYLVRGGKIAIEAKEELKRRLGRSPDRADALILAFAPMPQPCSGEAGVVRRRYRDLPRPGGIPPLPPYVGDSEFMRRMFG